jgi:hypothetical protein
MVITIHNRYGETGNNWLKYTFNGGHMPGCFERQITLARSIYGKFY